MNKTKEIKVSKKALADNDDDNGSVRKGKDAGELGKSWKEMFSASQPIESVSESEKDEPDDEAGIEIPLNKKASVKIKGSVDSGATDSDTGESYGPGGSASVEYRRKF